jgi:hypothetical protein
VVGIEGGRVPVRLRWSSRDADAVGYWLWKSVDGRPWEFVPVPNPAATEAVLELRRGRDYRFLVHAYDAAGNASPAAFGPSFGVRVLRHRARAMARHETSAGRRRSAARLSFQGRGVAWVSRTGPTGGRARVFVDGRYARTVSLYSPTSGRRTVAFSKSWRRSGRHWIAVRPTARSRRAPVDAFVVLR